MEDKKAKFVIYIAIALVAFVCSSIVCSMTGDLSDWMVASMNTNEDQNNNGILDSSEGGGFFSFNDNNNNGYDDNYNSYDDTYSYDDNNGPGIIDKIYNKIFNSDGYNSDSSYYYESSSNDTPDILARFLRMFMSNG